MNILVRGYINHNLGDDLFFKILFERYKTANFQIIGRSENLLFINDSYPNVHKISIKKTNFLSKITNKFIRKIPAQNDGYNRINDRIDAVVTIGGSLFMYKMPFSNYLISNYIRLYSFFPNAKYFFIGCNFGPIIDHRYFDFFYNLFSKVEDVCFRESYSANLFKSLSNVRYAPDVVFNLNINPVKKISNSIGISVIVLSRSKRSHLGSNDKLYYSVIANIISSAIEDCRVVRIFSFCKGQGDENAIAEIFKLLPNTIKDKVEKVLYRGNIDDFMYKFQEMETMLCTRFHAMILGLLFEQRIFPIIYSTKMTNVLNDIMYENDMVTTEEIEELNYRRVNKNTSLPISNIALCKENAVDQFKALDKYIYNYK